MIIDVIDVATSVVSACKENAAFEWSNAKIIFDTRKLRKDLDEARNLVQVAEAREKTLLGQVADLNIEVQTKSEAMLNAAEATEAHWRQTFVTAELAHAVEMRVAGIKLAEVSQSAMVQRSRGKQAKDTIADLTGREKELLDKTSADKDARDQEKTRLLDVRDTLLKEKDVNG